MIAATTPSHATESGRIAILTKAGTTRHLARTRQALADLFAPTDLLVVNDAATLPASLSGIHEPTGAPIEVRLAARSKLDWRAASAWDAVVFGAGDWRLPTEARPAPPLLSPGDVLVLGPLRARVVATLGHTRLVHLELEGDESAVWAGILEHGKPVQYAYMRRALQPWDVQTAVAGPLVAVEPPSAGFVLDWQLFAALRRKGVEVGWVTHAAGLSSTGDASLDARLPLPEPYHLPLRTAEAVAAARARKARVVALGTTVARALESAARSDGTLAAGSAFATVRLGPERRARVVDAIVTGVHEAGTSHFELLRAFANDGPLETLRQEVEHGGYRGHEFGDTCFVETAALG